MILEVKIPFQKLFCSPEIIPGKLPSYKNEYIVLGRDYESRVVDLFYPTPRPGPDKPWGSS